MRKRILHYYALVIGIAVLVTALSMVLLTNQLFQRRVVDDLRTGARVIASLSEGGKDTAALARVEGALRVTVVDGDGEVAFDSEANPAQMENHLDRVEIRQAIERGEGWMIRDSKTLKHNTFYYAMRLDDGRLLRVAQEASSIWNFYVTSAPLILILLAAMTGLSYWAATLLTRHLIAPIEQMTANLDDMSGVASYPELEPFMRKIEKQHREIVGSADMRVEFTANVSHELKTPLTSISGYAELVENGMCDREQTMRFAGEIRKSANRLLSLIEDIIRLSQLDAQMEEMPTEPVNLSAVAREALDSLDMPIRQMELDARLEGDNVLVLANRRMMEELTYNLCSNAVRYNVRGGRVVVTTGREDGHAVLSVRDTGIGISEEHQKHIFERFYRVDKSRSKATGGTGLGLAIVKHVAIKHHAEITTESEPGRGTCITVRFPRETM